MSFVHEKKVPETLKFFYKLQFPKKEEKKDRKTERQRDRKTERQKDRKTERQKDRITT